MFTAEVKPPVFLLFEGEVMLPSVAVVVFSFFCASLIHAFNPLVLLKCCLHKKKIKNFFF